MFFINRDLLNKKELIPKVEQATLDIGSCFFVQDSDSTVRVVLASYLLFEVSTMNNPTKISYKEMSNPNREVILCAVTITAFAIASAATTGGGSSF